MNTDYAILCSANLYSLVAMALTNSTNQSPPTSDGNLCILRAVCVCPNLILWDAVAGPVRWATASPSNSSRALRIGCQSTSPST